MRSDRISSYWLRGVGLLSVLAGVVVLRWSLLDPNQRTEDGFLSGTICLPIALSLAMMIWGALLPTDWRAFGGWLGLALIGQATTLQMIDAGQRIHYQHLRLPNPLVTEGQVVLLSILGAQALLVLVVARRRVTAIARRIRETLQPWQLAILLAWGVMISAAPGPDLAAYLGEILFSGAIQVLHLFTVALAVWAIPRPQLERWVVRFHRRFGTEPGTGDQRLSRPGLVLMASVLVVLTASFAAYFVYEGRPHIPDEVAYHFQARTLATGSMWLPAPSVPEAFEIYTLFVFEGRWFSIFPPGWPAVLALGFLLGVPWLVNPVLGGVNIALAYGLVRRLWDEVTARWVVLLLATSPWFVFMAMNLMSHTLALTLTLLGLLMITVAWQQGRWRWSLVSGAAFGGLFLTRPLDGVVAAGVVGLVVLVTPAVHRRLQLLTGLVVGFAALGFVALGYNWYITGSPTVFALDLYYNVNHGPGKYGIGFGAERGLGWALDAFPGHGPLEGLVNSLLNLFSVNTELHGWSVGSLLLAGLFLVAGRWQPRERLAVVWITGIVGAFFFYWYSGGPDFGARYWYLIIVPTVVLSVKGAELLTQGTGLSAVQAGERKALVAVALVMLSFLAVANYFPWRALDKYRHYLRMTPELQMLAEEMDFGRSLVLIRGQQHPDFAAAFVNNPLNLAADQPIYAWDRGPEVTARLMQEYGDRPVWIVEGPSITGAGYRVIRDPAIASGKPVLPAE